MAKQIIKYNVNTAEADWYIYKVDNEEILYKSQLTVLNNQIALIFSDNSLQKVVEEGVYSLDKSFLPNVKMISKGFLKKALLIDIYYINKEKKHNISWQSLEPFSIIDPEFNINLSINSYGSLMISMIESNLFFNMLKKEINNINDFEKGIYDFSTALINEHLKGTISDLLSNGISYLAIISDYGLAVNKLNSRLEPIFAEYGLKISELKIDSIGVSSENLKELNRLLQYKSEYAKLEGKIESSNDSEEIRVELKLKKNEKVMNKAEEQAQNPNNRYRCPECNAGLVIGSNSCHRCGLKIYKNCPSCGVRIAGFPSYCPQCATSLYVKK